MKRRVGAILVRDKRIVATGCHFCHLRGGKTLMLRRYNGTPRGLLNCNEGGCTRCNHGAHEDACLCLHAEENALLEAGRERINGATLYCNTYVLRNLASLFGWKRSLLSFLAAPV